MSERKKVEWSDRQNLNSIGKSIRSLPHVLIELITNSEDSYEVKDGLVQVEILNHSLNEYIGAKFSHKPNFMGDKKSYITTFTWDDVEYTHRFEKVSCAYENCARISDFR